MQTPPTEVSARPIFIPEIEQFGGAERSVLALSRWLSQRSLPHYILTYRDGCNFARYADYPLRVIDLQPKLNARGKIAKLRAHLKLRPRDAPALLCSGYQPALHATLAGERSFHTLMHDTPSLFGDSAHRTLKNKLRIAVSNRIAGIGLRSGGHTFVTSEYLHEECRRDFNVNADIVRMGGLVGSARNTRREARVDTSLRMLSVCRIENNKRIGWLLRALAELETRAVAPLCAPLSHVTDWRFDLAGKGSQIANLTAQAGSLGLADRVHFHGFVSDSALDQMYERADLFLMPALQGYGIPALEALARGLPVLLHRESGVSDLLLDTPWATVLSGGEENTTEALARAIEGVLRQSFAGVPQPALPTEEEWAGEVARLCGWA